MTENSLIERKLYEARVKLLELKHRIDAPNVDVLLARVEPDEFTCYNQWVPVANDAYRKERHLFPNQCVEQELRDVQRSFLTASHPLILALGFANFWMGFAEYLLLVHPDLGAELAKESAEHYKLLKGRFLQDIMNLRTRIDQCVSDGDMGLAASLAVLLDAHTNVQDGEVDTEATEAIAANRSFVTELLQYVLPSSCRKDLEELLSAVRYAVADRGMDEVLELAARLEELSLQYYPALHSNPDRKWDIIHANNYAGSLRLAALLGCEGALGGYWLGEPAIGGDLFAEQAIDNLELGGGAARAAEHIDAFVCKLDAYKILLSEDAIEFQAFGDLATKIRGLPIQHSPFLVKLFFNLVTALYFARLLQYPAERKDAHLEKLADEALKLATLLGGLDDHRCLTVTWT